MPCVSENTTLQCCCTASGMHNSSQCHVANQIVLISCARGVEYIIIIGAVLTHVLKRALH